MRSSSIRFVKLITQIVFLVSITLFILTQIFSPIRWSIPDQLIVVNHENDADITGSPSNSEAYSSSLIYGTLDLHQLNNTRHASRDAVFFNRVPKAGSAMMIELLQKLATRNDFQLKIYRHRIEYIYKPFQEMQLTSMMDALSIPSVYVQHMHYCNFTRYGYTMPIYFNLVRDPIERIISHYYFKRSSWHITRMKKRFPDYVWPSHLSMNNSFETCVLSGNEECRYTVGSYNGGIFKQAQFFCGHDDFCGEFGGERALQQAKQNVEKYYSVVGVLEEIDHSLKVMEQYIPRFFLGISEIYRDNKAAMMRVNKNTEKPLVSKQIKDMLRVNFTLEIEFYEFCKQRLNEQYVALQ